MAIKLDVLRSYRIAKFDEPIADNPVKMCTRGCSREMGIPA